MQGSDLKAFRKANNLTQSELGAYLGINKSFISTIESGKDPMPKDKLSKLLDNPYEWDTSMLTDSSKPCLVAEHKPVLSNTEILLRDMLAERDAKIDALYEEIGELKREIGRLTEQLRHKGESDAETAVSSSSASAV